MRTLLLRTAALLIIAAAVIADSGCSTTAAVQGAPPAPVSVVTARAEVSDVPIEIRLPAIVEPHVTVTVKAEIAGELRRVLVHEGQTIHRGDVLFEIEPEPYVAALNQAKAQLERDLAQVRVAQANLARDRAQARNARSQVERYGSLASLGIVPQEQHEQFKTNAEMAEQSVAGDDAALAAINAAVAVDRAIVDRAQVDMDHCIIRAPIDGTAGYLAIQQGNVIKGNADSALVTINEIAPAYVSFAVPDRYLDRLRQRLASGSLPLRVYEPNGKQELSHGIVNLLDNAVDSATGTIRVKGLVANGDHRLWPAESVEAVLTLSIERSAVTIPKPAVQQSERGWFAFTVKADHTVALQMIKTGVETESKVVVLDGIRPNEEVVVDGQLRLRPGVKVSIAKQAGALMRGISQ